MYDLTKNQKDELVKNVLLLNKRLKLLNEGITKRQVEYEINSELKLIAGSDSFLIDLLKLLVKTEKLCPNPKKTRPLGNKYPTEL